VSAEENSEKPFARRRSSPSLSLQTEGLKCCPGRAITDGSINDD
jgi:hypothetical protein